MTLRDSRFTGVFTALVTPFTPDGAAIDLDHLEDQIAFQGAGGVRGVVLAGTTGEAPTLTHAEWLVLARAGIAAARRHGLLAVLGTGSNATAHAVELQHLAADLGAHATLSVCPYYNRPTQEGLYRHFRAVAEATPIPVIVYNIPSRTGVALQAGTLARLAEIPTVVAVKESSGSVDAAGEFAARVPDLAVLSGDDALTLPMLAVGAVGVVSVVSNLLPRDVVRLCEAYAQGLVGEALAIHRALLPLVRALTAETNPIPIKGALRLVGRDSGTVRLPLVEPAAATVAMLRDALAATGLASSLRERLEPARPTLR